MGANLGRRILRRFDRPEPRTPGFHIGVMWKPGVLGSGLSNRRKIRRPRLALTLQALVSGRPSLPRARLILQIPPTAMTACCEGIAVAGNVAGSSLIRLFSSHR